MSEVELSLPAPSKDVEWAAVRSRRNQLLRACDYTQLPDYPATEAVRQEIAAYRQALRDIPAQGDDPWGISWPETPASID